MNIKSYLNYADCLKGNITLSNHKESILKELYQLSKVFGKSLYITSSFRTPRQNQICGGSPTSSHLKGLAFDIRCNNSVDRFNLLKAIHVCDIKRYGVYKNFIHVDFDNSKPQNVVWYE